MGVDLVSGVTQESTSISYITSGRRFVIYICQTRLIIIGSEMLKNSSFVNSSLRVIFDMCCCDFCLFVCLF